MPTQHLWIGPGFTPTHPFKAVPFSLSLFLSLFNGHILLLSFDQTSPVHSENSCSVAEWVEQINNHLHVSVNCSASL